MNNYNKLLITFIGKQDPYNKFSENGPILTLLKHRNDFSDIFLLYNEETTENLKKTENILKITYSVTSYFTNISNPTNYREILKELRFFINKFYGKFNKSNEVWISLSSGTPQMHTCWLILAASGEIKANLIHVNDPGKSKHPIVEIDPAVIELPKISVLTTPSVISQVDEKTPRMTDIFDWLG
jgi:sigma54-dependent transcription regulator